MISSFLGLQTSLKGLMAQQQALDVAAHNVANANTVGYTRQEATLGASDPLHLTAGATQNGAGAFLGQGVDVTAYRRLRDSFLDLQVRAQSMALGDATTSADALDRVQSAVGEPSTTGINALMGKFYTAWSDLANHPESDSSKQAVASAAQTLADAFGKLAGDITSATDDANAQFTSITGATGPIKAAATSLAQLNKAIDTAIDANQSPNDLLDRRDQILDDLSQYGQVSVTQLGNGRIQVMLGNQSVVNDTTADWQTPPPAGFAPGGGQLGALKTLAATTLPGYLASLDAVAKTLHDDVNNAYGSSFFGGTTAATLGTGIPA
ncbi:MAG TPA: flagellar hook-associated protein FlgK, partial [Solirubrobacteraceae bacterium]